MNKKFNFLCFWVEHNSRKKTSGITNGLSTGCLTRSVNRFVYVSVVNHPTCRHHFSTRVLKGVVVYTLCLLSLQMVSGTTHGTSLIGNVLRILRCISTSSRQQ